jgi:hypothetical protein
VRARHRVRAGFCLHLGRGRRLPCGFACRERPPIAGACRNPASGGPAFERKTSSAWRQRSVPPLDVGASVAPASPTPYRPPGVVARRAGGRSLRHERSRELRARRTIALRDKQKRGRHCCSEQYQQPGRVRWPDCRSAAIAGDGRLDALADPRLASKRLADPRRDPWPRLLMTKISRAELTMSRSLRALAITQ